jgi:hypothetical protein
MPVAPATAGAVATRLAPSRAEPGRADGRDPPWVAGSPDVSRRGQGSTSAVGGTAVGQAKCRQLLPSREMSADASGGPHVAAW